MNKLFPKSGEQKLKKVIVVVPTEYVIYVEEEKDNYNFNIKQEYKTANLLGNGTIKSIEEVKGYYKTDRRYDIKSRNKRTNKKYII